MLTDKLKNQLHLHFIVFIWGFTAILGALISIDALPLVWFRVLIASFSIFVYLKLKKVRFQERRSDLLKLAFGGILVALHWVTFFHAIKISTVSTTLITLSSTAFFVVLLKPFFEKKTFQLYELVLALFAVLGFVIIFNKETLYLEGMLTALVSAFLIAFFSLLNSRFIQQYEAPKIAFYELFFAWIFLGLVLLAQGKAGGELIDLSRSDLIYLLVLGIACTAYPFVAATELLKKMSPFTIVLTTNLEPVYGIILALLIFGDREMMSSEFYLGALIILSCVLLNGWIKNLKFKSDEASREG